MEKIESSHKSVNHELDLTKKLNTTTSYMHKCTGLARAKCDCDIKKTYY